ncbi:glycosyltransferase [uncultured Desulfosarcina sp.]|uniref:glycosyltransferase n=1 Tax=uncultured Desulfosarcina sp. TaxID=218289 RepID=UPI0029C705DB|nr:glycosyltransferase [uncultured Desulfosarcina sp.]
MRSKVSIVIPTFNQVRYLPSCFDHCIFQTYPNLEIIIVDGGSADGTKMFLGGLEKQIREKQFNPVLRMDELGNIVREDIQIYPQNRKVRIVCFDKDIGATQTYNEGLSRATGKYCTYIVGDDLPHPHMIEEMVDVIEKEKVDFIYSDMNLIDDDSQIIRQMRFPYYDFKKCFADWFHLGVSKLYRTDLHQRVGLMDEIFTAANDYDQYLRFAMAGAKFYHLPKVLYSVRWHGPERKTGQHTPARYKTLLDESKHCARRARAYLKKTIWQDADGQHLKSS